MGYSNYYQESNKAAAERFALAKERVKEIESESLNKEQYQDYFNRTAHFLTQLAGVCEAKADGKSAGRSIEQCRQTNEALYGQIADEAAYAKSYANPEYAKEVLGEAAAGLSMLLAHFFDCTGSAFRGNKMRITMAMELFVELYNMFEDEEENDCVKIMTGDISSYFHDYSDIFEDEAVRRLIDKNEDFELQIVEESDLSDLRYLYAYGAYIGDNELKTAAFLNGLPDEEIKKIADTITEGYRIGFEVTGKDLGKKETAQIRYPIGFERVVREVVGNLNKIGLAPTMSAVSVFPNRQYEYDHREDRALYLDKACIERGIWARRACFEEYKREAGAHAGPIVIDTFGELPFAPVSKPAAIRYNKKQQQLRVYEMSARSQLTNEYIKGEERSFTIIAFPVPAIGSDYEQIFRETVRINTLDYKRYRDMQQRMIDVLDTARQVHVTGKGANKTDLWISLYRLNNPEKETIFENCVADVNIPVGEIFTSPVLKGTEGKLFVSQVYLSGLNYKNLELDFKDGKIVSYTCANFADEEENKRYIRENLFAHHETLPMGEFAIGTNTTAYRMARKFGIADKLPILIAEKTGPHFAVGDTCYSHEEDLASYNPDGKAIVARENEISALRKEDMEQAYFNCHTDITIPYDELDKITAVREDGTVADVIADGHFVISGTEELNLPLDE